MGSGVFLGTANWLCGSGERRKGSCDTVAEAFEGLIIAGGSVTAFSPRPDTLK